MSFPESFLWGAATSAYQIEGAVTEAGRTPSIWDTFSRVPGAIASGNTGDVACDHFHRYRDDVATMAQLGLTAYRFSVAWPRVFPGGGTQVNAEGLDFYSRLVDELLAHSIVPVATMYHWDLPQPLQDAGGWSSRDTAGRFADYAAVVARALGDRVPIFTTLNEPWCSAFLGHATGEHAPGIKDDATALRAAHHLLLAHGLGVGAMRAELPPSAQLSITLNPALLRPVSESVDDRDACGRAQRLGNEIFAGPLAKGCYPPELIDDTAHLTDWSFVADGDLAAIQAPIDVLGVNYYFPQIVGARPADPSAPQRWPGSGDVFVQPQPRPQTAMGWAIDPAGLTELLAALSAAFPGLPMMITENGAAFDDIPDDTGVVVDEERAEYLRAHVGAVAKAMDAGVDVRGYFAWSLLDNFEWAWGYGQRFGLVRVDYESQRRTVKHSGYVYRDVIAAATRATPEPSPS